MEQILERLWLGNFEDAEVAHLSAFPKFGALVTLCEAAPQTPLALFHSPIPDEIYLPASVWQCRVELLVQLQDSLVTTLVHCRLGVSRSPALVAAYLAYRNVMPDVTKALGYVMGRRNVVKVHEATWQGVEAWFSSRSSIRYGSERKEY